MSDERLSLYEIETGLAELMQAREEAQGPDEIAAVEAAMQEYVSREVQKVDGIRGFIRFGKAAAKECREAADKWDARVDRVLAMVRGVMDATGQRRINGKLGYFAIRGNGGLAPLKVQDDVLPDEYRDVTVTMPLATFRDVQQREAVLGSVGVSDPVPANGRIREALKDGVEVPGAWLEPRGEHLEVR